MKITSGKTSGSRVCFKNSKNDKIILHKPHPSNIMKEYQIKEIVNYLIDKGLI